MIKYIEQKATELQAKKNKVLAKALEEADTKNTATVVKPRNVPIWSGGDFHTWSESVQDWTKEDKRSEREVSCFNGKIKE